MELTWLDPRSLDHRDIDGAVAVLEAARAVDCPSGLGPTVSSFTGLLRHGWDGDPSTYALTRDTGGRVTAVLETWLPRWDNTHLSGVRVTVDPLARRRGLGRALFAAGVERTRAEGRRLVLADCYELPANVGFCTAVGLERASMGVERRLKLPVVDRARLDHEYRAAERHAAGYEPVRIPGSTPEDLLADVAELTAAINDAPTDDLDVEDEVFTPARIGSFEAAQQGRGRRLYRLVARERDTGVLAGHTIVGVDSERPWHAWQFDTSVLPAHRGHRLGLFLKLAMLHWLGAEEPQVRVLDTSNAASNAHMIRVNEIIGYEITATTIGWQQRLR